MPPPRRATTADVSSVVVRFHGPIDRRGLPQDHRVDIDQGATIESLLGLLGYPPNQRRVILANIAGEQRKHSDVLSGGEVVEIFVVASGG